MAQIGIRQLKNHATEIVREIREHRTEYIVTHRGKPVAFLLPVTETLQPTSPETTQAAPQPSNDLLAELEALLAQNKALPARNRQALAVMHDWLSVPDADGAEWWAEFDADLRESRLAPTRQ